MLWEANRRSLNSSCVSCRACGCCATRFAENQFRGGTLANGEAEHIRQQSLCVTLRTLQRATGSGPVASYRRTQQDSGSSLNYNPDRMSTARLRLLFIFSAVLRHRGRIVDRLRTATDKVRHALRIRRVLIPIRRVRPDYGHRQEGPVCCRSDQKRLRYSRRQNTADDRDLFRRPRVKHATLRRGVDGHVSVNGGQVEVSTGVGDELHQTVVKARKDRVLFGTFDDEITLLQDFTDKLDLLDKAVYSVRRWVNKLRCSTPSGSFATRRCGPFRDVACCCS